MLRSGIRVSSSVMWGYGHGWGLGGGDMGFGFVFWLAILAAIIAVVV